jgi:hypothetical protein
MARVLSATRYLVILGVIACALGVFGLLIAVRAGSSPLFNTLDWSEGRRGIVMLVACGVAVFALERIGYRLTMIALLVFMLGVVERPVKGPGANSVQAQPCQRRPYPSL